MTAFLRTLLVFAINSPFAEDQQLDRATLQVNLNGGVVEDLRGPVKRISFNFNRRLSDARPARISGELG